MTAADALERCVGDRRRFAREHWGRHPLLRRGAGRFADLLDLPDVDHLVTETLLRMPSFRLVKDGTPLPASEYTQTIRIGSSRVDRTVRPERVAEAFEGGATIVLQALHRLWPPVAEFCRELELALTHPVQANAYVTPPTARGFSVHHDTHDVFVLQTHGHKRWRVYRPLVELAGPEQPWSKALGEPEAPILEADLGPGDVLYVPRGFLHDAEAREEVSIHVTVGVLTLTWLDLWRHVMGGAPGHLPFREALPIGFARDPSALGEELPAREKELRAWLDEVDLEAAVSSFVRRFWANRRPLVPGQLQQVGRLARVHTGSRFRRRPGTAFIVSVDGDEASVILAGKELRMPAFAEPDLRFVAEAPGAFGPPDLPGTLDQESRLVLLRRLVREGAVEVVDAG
ncbi:MAG TPA: cupin domain-containing protein [Actinomycetota bacterium]|nr:cupin domain-containing protein [Actinomycetota bacterium]